MSRPVTPSWLDNAERVQALTINVHEANAATPLPESLAARLNSTPTKSPTELDEEIKAHEARSAALRQVHLDSVRDRAARTSQLAREAAARKLRNAAAKVEKLQAKIDAADTKTSAKKEADEAKKLQAKERREALALAVADARKAAGDERTIRHMQRLQLEHAAAAKHAFVVTSVKDKGAAAVKHAAAVRDAHKEKEALAAASRGVALESKLAAAEVRREARTSRESPLASPTPTTECKERLHRVRNECKVEAETKRKLFASREAKANESRAAHLAAVVGKASAENAKAAAVVTKAQLIAKGTDPATVEARQALYERMVRAEVARLTALKAKYAALKPPSAKGDEGAKQERLLVVRLDDIVTPRSPPEGLVRRLAVARTSLLATAAHRHAGAATRREMAKQALLLKLGKAGERRAAARARVSKTLAALTAALAAKATANTVNKALVEGKAAHTVSLARKRFGNATAKREALGAAARRAGEAAAAKCAAAAERRAAALTARGKKGGSASERRAAHLGRREALRKAVASRGEALAARCTMAAAGRAALLATRVETARKHVAARHPKREVAHMEVEASSEA